MLCAVPAVLRCTRLLLALLACLAAPEGPRPRGPRATDATASEISVGAAGADKAEVRSCFVVPAHFADYAVQAQYPPCPPYVGYRRDLIASLASLSHGNAGVVREIVSAGKCLSCSTVTLHLTMGLNILARRRADSSATMSG